MAFGLFGFLCLGVLFASGLTMKPGYRREWFSLPIGRSISAAV
jgi:hypothetical protein